MEIKDINGNKPCFTGFWIPAEILQYDLKLSEIALYGIISSFGNKGCYMLALDIEKLLGISAATRKRAIKHLKDLGFITAKKQINGRMLLKSTLGFQSPQEAPQGEEEPKMSNEPSCEPKALETQEKGLIRQNSNEVQVQYGNEDINWCFAEWASVIGTPLTSKTKMNRYACRNLLKKQVSENIPKGRETITNLLKLVRESKKDKYAPRITDFADLQANMNRLFDWATRTRAQQEAKEDDKIADLRYLRKAEPKTTTTNDNEPF